MERLQKYLARAGISSRRAAEQLILDGRVKVNGQVVTTLGTKVDANKDLIVMDGAPVVASNERQWYLFYKPPGVVTTMSDPQGRPTVGEYVDRLEGRVFPVGRLDYDAEGALLLTDDGETANKLMHPKHQVPRVYLAKVKGSPDDASLEKLRGGVRLEDGLATPTEVSRFEKAEKNTWIKIVVTEGRPHLVKRLFAAIGHPVVRLYRPQHAGIGVEGVKPGEFRALTVEEVRLVKAAGDGRGTVPNELRLPARRHGHGAGSDDSPARAPGRAPSEHAEGEERSTPEGDEVEAPSDSAGETAPAPRSRGAGEGRGGLNPRGSGGAGFKSRSDSGEGGGAGRGGFKSRGASGEGGAERGFKSRGVSPEGAGGERSGSSARSGSSSGEGGFGSRSGGSERGGFKSRGGSGGEGGFGSRSGGAERGGFKSRSGSSGEGGFGSRSGGAERGGFKSRSGPRAGGESRQPSGGEGGSDALGRFRARSGSADAGPRSRAGSGGDRGFKPRAGSGDEGGSASRGGDGSAPFSKRGGANSVGGKDNGFRGRSATGDEGGGSFDDRPRDTGFRGRSSTGDEGGGSFDTSRSPRAAGERGSVHRGTTAGSRPAPNAGGYRGAGVATGSDPFSARTNRIPGAFGNKSKGSSSDGERRGPPRSGGKGGARGGSRGGKGGFRSGR